MEWQEYVAFHDVYLHRIQLLCEEGDLFFSSDHAPLPCECLC